MTALEGKRVKQGSAGARHSIVLTDDGEIYGWGDNEQGQLGELARFGLQLLRICNPFRCLLEEFCAECRTEFWNCLITSNCNGELPFPISFCSETQLSPMLLWGFEDGKRPLFVVAGGEHTVVVFDMVPGDYLISGQERLVHVRFSDPTKHFPVLFASEGWPKQLFSCTCWLHDSVLF